MTAISTSAMWFLLTASMLARAGAAQTGATPPGPSVPAIHFPGVDPSGATDSTTGIQSALTAAAGRCLHVNAGTYKISKALEIPSNTIVEGEGKATLFSVTNGNINCFSLYKTTQSTVRGLAIEFTSPGATPYVGGICANTSERCTFENLEIKGASWAGILIWASNKCTVRNCRFSGALGAVQDRSDICLFWTANDNMIDGNQCFGAGDHGIFLQAPGKTGYTPTGNTIRNNKVGPHNGYGIVCYQGSPTTYYDSKTRIVGNEVSGVLGSALSGSSGSGIYIQGLGGVLVSENHVENCNTKTTNFPSLGVAHIAVINVGAGTVFGASGACVGNQLTLTANLLTPSDAVVMLGATITGQGIKSGTTVTAVTKHGVLPCVLTLSAPPSDFRGSTVQVTNPSPAAAFPVNITNNTIIAPQGFGINASTNNVPVIISGNKITHTGTAAMAGNAIKIANSTGAKVLNNTISHVNQNFNAVAVIANGLCLDGVEISGNKIVNGGGGGIYFNSANGGVFSNLAIDGNQVTGGTTPAFFLSFAYNVFMTKNSGESKGPVFYLSNCRNALLKNNMLTSSGTGYGFILTGSKGLNAGTLIDESNTIKARIRNEDGTGSMITQFGLGAPTSGLWAVGDRIIQPPSAVGGSKSWRCITPGEGSASVFKSE